MINLSKVFRSKYLILITLPFLFFTCDIRNSKHKKDSPFLSNKTRINDSTKVQIIDSVYNFGKITEGQKVEFNFRFKNVGTHPLIIESAIPSCGCTIADKPEKPVLTGETGTIKVVFNSSGRAGDVHKEIDVLSNSIPSFPVLELRGVVLNK